MPLRVARFRAMRAFDEAQTDNEWLIPYCREVAGEPAPRGSAPAFLNHALEAASRRQSPYFNGPEALPCADA
jgi:hypothetical protein